LTIYLEDIKLACIKIQKYVVGMTFEQFQEDDKTFDAVTRNIEIIGEAAKKLPLSFRDKHPEIEWRQITGMRDVVAHNYSEVDPAIVWDVAVNEVPELLAKIQQII